MLNFLRVIAWNFLFTSVYILKIYSKILEEYKTFSLCKNVFQRFVEKHVKEHLPQFYIQPASFTVL